MKNLTKQELATVIIDLIILLAGLAFLAFIWINTQVPVWSDGINDYIKLPIIIAVFITLVEGCAISSKIIYDIPVFGKLFKKEK